MRLGLIGIDSSHAEDFLRYFNSERRHHDIRVTALWGEDPTRAGELHVRWPDAKPVSSLDEIVARIDAAVVGDRDGGEHRDHALAAIAAGRPIFVDKPLANTLADATAIAAAAEAAGVPLLSGSALRWQADTLRLAARMSGLESPIHLRAWGTWYPRSAFGGAVFYAIHVIELVQQLLGTTWSDLEVEANGERMTVRYRSGRDAVTLDFRPPVGESASFGIDLSAGDLSFHQPIPLGDDYMRPVVDQVAAMLRSGRSPLARDELLAPLALMDAIAARL